MLIDIFEIFKKNISNIDEIIRSAYPTGSLDTNAVIIAFCKLEVLSKTIRDCLDICLKEEIKVGILDSNRFLIFNHLLKVLDTCIASYRKNTLSAHGELQGLLGALNMTKFVLDSFKNEPS